MAARTLTVTVYGIANVSTDRINDIIGVLSGVTSTAINYPYGSDVSLMEHVIEYDDTLTHESTILAAISFTGMPITNVTLV